MTRPFFVVALGGLAAGVLGCSRAEPARASTTASAHGGASAAPPGSAAPRATSQEAVPSASAATHTASAASDSSAAPGATKVLEAATGRGLPLAFGALADVGPAAPATAAKEGVVFVTKDDRVLVAARTPGAHPDQARFAALDEPRDAFPMPGRGPGVAQGFAYWISHGRLVRRALAPEHELEILADGAREHSRVTAVELGGRTAVAFLGRPNQEGTSHARLWLEGGPTFDLTPEGAGASSVSLASVGDHLLATSIDGRSAMTPMHARRIELGPHPELRPDVVVWVGGPAQPWTETFVGSEASEAFAYVPIERDVTHFGLATVALGAEPHMDSNVTFFDYPNGLDLAPVANAWVCGHEHVAYVRPTTSIPHSPTELVLLRLSSLAAAVATTARGFASVSLVRVQGGGVLAYVADGRTWALGFRCVEPK